MEKLSFRADVIWRSLNTKIRNEIRIFSEWYFGILITNCSISVGGIIHSLLPLNMYTNEQRAEYNDSK